MIIMYENIIEYYPLTGNTIMRIKTGEDFYYEEDGVGAILTPVNSAIINTPKPEVYCR